MRNYYGENALGTVNLKAGTHLINPYPKGFTKVDLVPGKSGDWAVEKFTVTPDSVGLYNLRLIRDGRQDRIVPPGEYTRLLRGGSVVMSDTPAEAREHMHFYKAAKGRVLVNGLGLGFGLKAVLSKPSVKEVTVVEFSADVVKLVGNQIKDPRVTVVQDDALTYKPVGKYDVVWHDIWDDICGNNINQMKGLRKRYARIAKWQGVWSEKYI